jgi:hypothetical protein
MIGDCLCATCSRRYNGRCADNTGCKIGSTSVSHRHLATEPSEHVVAMLRWVQMSGTRACPSTAILVGKTLSQHRASAS